MSASSVILFLRDAVACVRRAACGRIRDRSQRRPDPVGGSLEGERLHEPDRAVLCGDVAGLERRGDEPVDGCDDDDPPFPTRAKVRPRVPGEEERARQQHRKERIPPVLVELLERRDVLEVRVGDDRVDAAEALDDRVDRRPVSSRVASRRRTARPARRDRAEVDGEHVPPVGDEPLRDRTPDAARGTRDERLPGSRPSAHVDDLAAHERGVGRA